MVLFARDIDRERATDKIVLYDRAVNIDTGRKMDDYEKEAARVSPNSKGRLLPRPYGPYITRLLLLAGYMLSRFWELW